MSETDNRRTLGSASIEDYEDERRYSAFRSGSLRPGSLLAVVVAIGLIVVAAFFWLGSCGSEEVDTRQVAQLQERMERLEAEVAQLAALKERIERLEADKQSAGQSMQRIDRLEASLNRSIQNITGELEKLQTQKTPPAAAAPAATSPGGKLQVHVVAAGETLYQISRRYGVTVDDLVKANRLENGATIRPGQEIIVPSVRAE
jgi:LysM repeat protein